MAKPLRPFVRGGGYYPSKKWIPLVRNGGYTTQNGGETEPVWATASGAIASFTTPFAYPLKKLVAQINPVQDLHGQDAPYPGGGGKNKFSYANISVKNIYRANVQQMGTDPNAFYLAGSAGTSDTMQLSVSSWAFVCTWIGYQTTAETTLTVSCKVKNYSADCNGYIRIRYGDTQDRDGSTAAATTFFNDVGQYQVTATATIPSGKYVGLEFSPAAKASEFILTQYTEVTEYQLETGSTATAFAPYSNICPISGWTGLEGQRTGANLFDKTTITDNAYVNGAGVVTPNTEFFCSDYISVKPETAYYIFTDINGRMDTIRFYDANKAVIGGSAYQKRVVTTPAKCAYIRINAIKSHVSADEVFFNYPSTDTSYHAYTGEAISVSWQDEAGTVYGGSDEVVSGNGTSTMGMVDLGTLNWTLVSGGARPNFFSATLPTEVAGFDYISSMYSKKGNPYGSDEDLIVHVFNYASTGSVLIRNIAYTTAADFKTAMSGVQLCYELATPTTFTHSPQEVDTLVGQNNVWVTSGDVEVTYRIE